MKYLDARFINANSLKEKVLACYAFLMMDFGYNKELSLITEKRGKTNTKTYSEKNAVNPSFQIIWRKFNEEFKSGAISCIGSFDKEDKSRFGLHLYPGVDSDDERPLQLAIYDETDGKYLDDLKNALINGITNLQERI